MQQRVEILKMLYRGAEILIFDEPTAVLTRVKTAVGSSKMRISAPRYNIFKISTRCCIPTDIFSRNR